MPGRSTRRLVPLRGQTNMIRWIQAQNEREELPASTRWASCAIKNSVTTPFQRTQQQTGIAAAILLSYAFHGVTWATFAGTAALIKASQPQERPIRQSSGPSTLVQVKKPRKPAFVNHNKPCELDQNAGLY